MYSKKISLCFKTGALLDVTSPYSKEKKVEIKKCRKVKVVEEKRFIYVPITVFEWKKICETHQYLFPSFTRTQFFRVGDLILWKGDHDVYFLGLSKLTDLKLDVHGRYRGTFSSIIPLRNFSRDDFRKVLSYKPGWRGMTAVVFSGRKATKIDNCLKKFEKNTCFDF